MVRFQQFFGHGDALVQILFVGFVSVNAEEDISPTDESELWGTIVESGDLQHITNTITI